MNMSVDVEVQYAFPRDVLPKPADFRRWAKAALEDAGPAETVIRIVDEAESARLNEAYRGKTGATNVLSFPFEAPPQVKSKLLGDLVLCAPVVQCEARVQGKPESAHWAHLVIHGILHLRGYDHQNEIQAAEMEAREVEIMRSLGYANPYEPTSEPVPTAGLRDSAGR